MCKSDPRVFYRNTLHEGEGQFPVEPELLRPEGQHSRRSQQDYVVAAREVYINCQVDDYGDIIGQRLTDMRNIQLVAISAIIEILQPVLSQRFTF